MGKGDGNAVSMPMYCKHLIYCGMKEFSFEELRAAVVHKKEEEEKKKRLEGVCFNFVQLSGKKVIYFSVEGV